MSLNTTLNITKAEAIDADTAIDRILSSIIAGFKAKKIKSPPEMEKEIRTIIEECLGSVDYRISTVMPVLRASFIALRGGSFDNEGDASEILTIREDIDGQRMLIYAEGGLENDTVSAAAYKITRVALRYNVFLWPPKGWKVDAIVIDAFDDEQVRYHEYLLNKAIDIRP